MRETRIVMGMPATVELHGANAKQEVLEAVFAYFTAIDTQFSTYKTDSEISRINRGEVTEEAYSPRMKEVLAIAEDTKKKTNGYFDVLTPSGSTDPSGLVKGWAIRNAAELLEKSGMTNFMIDVAGDIATRGKNAEGMPWSIGIRNPFNREEIVQVVYPHDRGIATSGSAVRGNHIYNPHAPEESLDEVVSVSVIAPDVLTADLYATTAFAMGAEGIRFVESTQGLEGYAIDKNGIAAMTSGWNELTTI